MIPTTTRHLSHLFTRNRLLHKTKLLGRTLSTTSTTTPRTPNYSPRPHRLNINHALKKSSELLSFCDLADHSVETLQGIGPKHAEDLSSLGLTTVRQLAEYRFYHLARSVVVLAETEEADGRPLNSVEATEVMNLDKGLDKDFEGYPLRNIIEQPISALQGLTPAAGETFKSMGVQTVEDLAKFKYCQWAEAIVAAGQFEVSKDQ